MINSEGAIGSLVVSSLAFCMRKYSICNKKGRLKRDGLHSLFRKCLFENPSKNLFHDFRGTCNRVVTNGFLFVLNQGEKRRHCAVSHVFVQVWIEFLTTCQRHSVVVFVVDFNRMFVVPAAVVVVLLVVVS